jgi:prepilin peptidase CpaA
MVRRGRNALIPIPLQNGLFMLHALTIALLPSLMILAAISDLMSLRIPNWLTGLIAALFFPMAWATGMPLAEFGWHLLAGVILFVAGYILFELRMFGGGDAKLMAAAGLWFGSSQAFPFIFMTVLAGGALAVAVMLWSLALSLLDMHGGGSFTTAMKRFMPKLPYGFAFAVGAIIAYPQTWWITSSGAV